MFNQDDFDSITRAPKAKNYSPLFEDSTSPYFLSNRNWYRPCMIVIFGNIVLAVVIVLLLRECMTTHDVCFSLLIGQLIVWDISYLLTQFLNPGIQLHNSQNPELRYDQKESTRYCNDCDAYIEGYDHHCGWFQKCIGKYNKYPFYLFLICTFGIFFTTMYSLFTCEPRIK